ncbi:MAG: PAS domain S-box protein [Pseudomonadota bacterium]
MSEAPEKMQHELATTQRVLAELRERFDRQEEAHRAAVEELENNRKALLFMLEDLEASRKKIEQAHHEWVTALDGVKEPIFVHDREFRILRANRAYAARAGLTVQEVIGRRYWEVFPKGEVSHHCFTLVAEAVSGDTRHESTQDEIVLPDGGVLVCHDSVVRNEQGEYLFSVHVMEDITERKRMEQALQESEEKFRSISASAHDAIIMMGPDKRVAFWNAAAERMFGYRSEEALGQEVHRLISPSIWHDVFEKAIPLFLATGKGPVVGKVLELNALKKGGEEFPVELVISSMQLGGKWHAIGIVRDITARKRAEAGLLRASRALKTLSEGNRTLIYAKEETSLLHSMCEILVGVGGYRLAWVGYAR